MSSLLQRKKYLGLMAFFSLVILIVAGYLIVQAQNERQIEVEIGKNAQKLPPRTQEEVENYILERKQVLKGKAAESPDRVDECLILLKNYTPAADVATLCEQHHITLSSIQEIFITQGSYSGGARFGKDAVADLAKKGIRSVREYLNHMTETHKQATARTIRMQQQLIDSGKNDTTEDGLHAKQAYRDSIAQLQEYQSQLDISGVPVYALKMKERLAVLQAISEHPLVRLVDLREDALVGDPWHIKP